jgi:hypothetical protein
MQLGLSEVGMAFRAGDLLFEPLVTAFADHLKPGLSGGAPLLRLVVDGNVQVFVKTLAEGAGEGDALLHGDGPR